ncbi:MAG: methyltransferase domain-containing protein [Robiginitomaculum sp.]|nr:methyltransferase domain-containing protein [Robiginitomaculum sp.]MDQ7078170.1 methyltransferase domain-containing protein [Robiginitomaculum sp.]
MKTQDKNIISHYQDDGLLDRIDAGLCAAGLDPEKVKAADLTPVDEFHIGGREMTLRILSMMNIKAGDQVLDIGCGIGGAARTLVAETGCRVTGIDLTPEYIDVAKTLTARCGMEERLQFQVANACGLPFEDETFDGAITLHVAMNIEDRVALYAEAARVLKPGADFAIYDVMRTNDKALAYPAPWATSEKTSFLKTPAQMRALLHEAGFELIREEDHGDMARAFFQKASPGADQTPPPLGVHVVMGADAPLKIRNTMKNLQARCITPVVMMARKRS